MEIKLEPRRVFVTLLLSIFFLLSANVTGIISTYYLGHGSIFGLVPMFNFDNELNIPTFYSSLTIMLCSILLSIIGASKKNIGNEYLYWYGLAIIFLFLSIDEILSIHERLIIPVRKSLNTSGLLYFAWVIPYAISLIFLMLIYFKFLINLPKRTMLLFIVSGMIYVLGAIGFELLGGWQFQISGKYSIIYSFIWTCEELFEMLGIAVFVYALVSYIGHQIGYLTIRLK
jgi:hypothetical protein